MERLPEQPTKEQEIAYWRDFVASLPSGSYLRNMLSGSESQIEQMIRNDFCFCPLPDLRRNITEAQTTIRELQTQRKKLEDDIREQQRRLEQANRAEEHARKALERIRDEARRIANA